MIVYVKNTQTLQKSYQNLVVIINLFSNATGHQVNTEISFVFLYTRNKSKIKLKKLSFIIKAKPLTRCKTSTLKSQNTSQRN